MNSRVISTAVMQRRHEPADSLDFFPTPPWGTRAFVRHVLPTLVHPDDLSRRRTAWDPCCGEGHMALALAESFDEVFTSDIFDYGGNKVADFTHPDFVWHPADWIFMNPPFNQGAEFVQKALKLARVGVAVLARTAFVEGQERWRELFRVKPPQVIAFFVERLPMHRGRWVVKGKSATAYSWLAWMKNPTHDQLRIGTRAMWIQPSRTTLTRPDDWEKFRGCSDIPKKHAVMKIAEQMAAHKRQLAARPKPASLADVRRSLELKLGGLR